MRNIFVLILPLAMAQGCSLLRHTEKTTENLDTVVQENSAVKVSEKRNLTTEAGGVFLHQDSSATDYSVLIYPKGSFSISADGSFSGEAEKIKISGKAKNFGSSASALKRNEQDQGQLDVTATKNGKSTTSIKSAVTTSSWWNWNITALVVLLLVALLCAAKWLPAKQNIF